MTINEIQTTIDLLRSRHPQLDERLLTTLLLAGGWEQKHIEEAKLLFKGRAAVAKDVLEPEEKLLASPHDMLLEEHTAKSVASLETSPNEIRESLAPKAEDTEVATPQEVVVQADSLEPAGVTLVEEVEPEKESLIIREEPPLPPKKQVELPENLPLKPFEESSHVWPFSRYKDVFHGETMPQKAEEVSRQASVELPAQQKDTDNDPQYIHFSKTPLTKGDEGLIVTACTLFVIILLLLGYMYSNGRL